MDHLMKQIANVNQQLLESQSRLSEAQSEMAKIQQTLTQLVTSCQTQLPTPSPSSTSLTTSTTAQTKPSVIDIQIHGFYHICTLNYWRAVVDEQVSLIVKSGLYDRCACIHISIVGEECHMFDELLTGISNSKFAGRSLNKFKVEYCSKSTEQYERTALNLIKLHCDAVKNTTTATTPAAKQLVFYIHSKGVRCKSDALCIDDWRQYLMYYIVERHEDCIRALETYDACGVNLERNVEQNLWFYSGNFWWATVDYLMKLRSIEIAADYLGPEMWIGIAQPYAVSFKQSGLNHYKSRYPRSQYIIK